MTRIGISHGNGTMAATLGAAWQSDRLFLSSDEKVAWLATDKGREWIWQENLLAQALLVRGLF